MINKIKQTLSQVFSSSEDSTKLPFWDEADIECAIDEEVVECSEMDKPFTGVPAPVVLSDDPWFGPAVISDKGQDYMEKEAEIKQQEEENRQYWTKEFDNIHEAMYKMATKSGSTTLHLDPIGGSENFQGGSENIHR